MALKWIVWRERLKIVIVLVVLTLLPGSLPISVLAHSALELATPSTAPPAIAPDYKFTQLSLKDGLSQTTVVPILQDSRGFMWIGTQDGLNRYDGYNFIVYRNNPGDLSSLGGNFVRALIEDPSGCLWIGTVEGGLNKYDPSTDSFICYKHDPDNTNSMKNNTVWSIWQDESGLLWLYMDDGWLTRFDPKSETFTHYHQTTPAEKSNLDIARYELKTIYQDKAGALWLSSYQGGLARFSRETGRFTHFRHDPKDDASIGAGEVTNVYEDGAGNLWVSTTEGGLNLLDRESGQFSHFQYDPDDPYSISDNSCHQVFQDRKGTYWVATGKGLNRFDPGKKHFFRYLKDPTNPYALSDDNIYTIYEDRGGVLWIGTNGGGINNLDLGTIQIIHYRNLPGNQDTLSTSYIYSIYEDEDGILWVGGDDGVLNRFDRENHHVTRYEPDANNPHALNESWSVSAIYEDRTGVFWVGTFGGGLHAFDRKTEQFQRYLHNPDEPHSISSDIILAIFEDSSGTLWIGTDRGGLNRFDRRTLAFHRYMPDPDDQNNLHPGNVRGIYEDRLGQLWLTGWGEGLTRFDSKTERFVRYRHDPENPQSLSIDTTYVVHEDQTGTLWVGTSGGLNKFDRKTETFKCFTVKDGLPNNVIYAIMEDEAGYLWVSTNRGVSEFDPRSETFHNYNVFDGLQSDEFNQNAFFKSNSGEMFFGGINGLNAFYPDQISNNPYHPPVILTDLQLFNQSVAIGEDSILPRAIWDMQHITLNYDQDVFSFGFAALSYAAPEENRYRYKLEGFDDNWIAVDAKRRFATYTNLPPGDYKFRVQGANEDGVWNEEGVSLGITIAPAWWARWWFRGTTVALLLSMIFGGYHWRVSSMGRRSQELESQVADRTAQLKTVNKELEAFAYSVSHDLRAPLRHIGGFLELLEKKAGTALDEQCRHYIDAISEATRNMGSLIDDLLAFSRMGRHALSFQKVDLGILVREVIGELEPDASGRKIVWHIGEFPEVRGDTAMLRIVLFNLIANALKFTRPRERARIEIGSLSGRDNEAVFFVRDNGVGFEMAYADKLFGVFERLHRAEEFEGTGIGLATVHRIVARLGGQTWAEGGMDQGATFFFSLPCRQQ